MDLTTASTPRCVSLPDLGGCPTCQRAPGENSRKIRHPAQEAQNSRGRSVRGYEVAVRQVGAGLMNTFFADPARYNLSDLVNHILIIQTDYSWPKEAECLENHVEVRKTRAGYRYRQRTFPVPDGGALSG